MNITFRTQLLGSISDFCTECDLALATPEVLVDLIVRLSGYREESTELAPQVYLTENIDLLVQMLPEGEKISISSAAPDASGVGQMLKICAPLATKEWRIFGQLCEHEMQFGLFRGSSNPLSVGVDDMLLSAQDESTVIKTHQIADQCVHIQSSKSHNHHIFFNHRRQESPPPLQHIDDLLEYMLKRVDLVEIKSISSFLKNTLTPALLRSHGCILAVTNMRKSPKILSRDGIILGEPIDFPFMVRQLKRARHSSLLLQRIERKADLLKGMIGSDGITIFDQYGRLLGYRCFVPLAAKSAVVGGARRRAFETLRSHLGRGLCAIFIQSQDGWTEFRSIDNE